MKLDLIKKSEKILYFLYGDLNNNSGHSIFC